MQFAFGMEVRGEIRRLGKKKEQIQRILEGQRHELLHNCKTWNFG